MKQAQRRRAEGILYTDHYQLTMAHLYFRMGLRKHVKYFIGIAPAWASTDG